MEKGTFGERLRREREMRGVSLEEISSATRISTRFLEALEHEQWEHLPGGVFNRGFIRAVARFLGLDEESLIGEYALATDDQPEVAVWAGAPGQGKGGRRLLTRLVVLLLVATGGWFAYRHFGPQLVRAWRSPLPQAVTFSPPVAPSVPPETPTAVASAPTGPVEPANIEPQTLELQVEAGKATVATVLADGKTVFDGKVNPGQSLRFRAQQRFEVSVRDASAVLLELNSQTVPPLGPPGQPGSITLTRKDLAKSSGETN